MKLFKIYKFPDGKYATLTYHRQFEEQKYFDVNDLWFSVTEDCYVRDILHYTSIRHILQTILSENEYFFSPKLLYDIHYYCDWLTEVEEGHIFFEMKARFLKQLRQKENPSAFLFEFLRFLLTGHRATAKFLEEDHGAFLGFSSYGNRDMYYFSGGMVEMKHLDVSLIEELPPKEKEKISIKGIDENIKIINSYGERNFRRLYQEKFDGMNIPSCINQDELLLMMDRHYIVNETKIYKIVCDIIISKIRICKDQNFIIDIHCKSRKYYKQFLLTEIYLDLNPNLTIAEQRNFLTFYRDEIDAILHITADIERNKQKEYRYPDCYSGPMSSCNRKFKFKDNRFTCQYKYSHCKKEG